MSLLTLLFIGANAADDREKCTMGTCDTSGTTCYHFESNGYATISTSNDDFCIPDDPVSAAQACSVDQDASFRAVEDIPLYNALCPAGLTCYYKMGTIPATDSAVCMDLSALKCNAATACDTLDGPLDAICVIVDELTGLTRLHVDGDIDGICMPPDTVVNGEVCSVDPATADLTVTVNRMCEDAGFFGTCTGFSEGEPATCRAAAAPACGTDGFCDGESTCMLFDSYGFAETSGTTGFCIATAQTEAVPDTECTVTIRSLKDTERDMYIASCDENLVCVVDTSKYPTTGTCKAYSPLTCSSGVTCQEGLTCNSIAEGIATPTSDDGVCLIPAVAAGDACSTVLSAATDPITEDNMIRACPADAPICAVKEDGLFGTTGQAECTVADDASSSTEAPTLVRQPCTFGTEECSGEASKCYFFEENGFAAEVDGVVYSTGFCIAADPVGAGEPCSAVVAPPKVGGVEVAIEYNALCEPDHFCYYNKDNTDTLTTPAVCMPLNACTDQAACDNAAIAPLGSSCMTISENGVASVKPEAFAFTTVRGATKAAEDGVCLPGALALAGEACSIDAAVEVTQINRACVDGGACTGYAEDYPATCRAPTGPACTGGDALCAAPSMCGYYQDGIFTVAEADVPGFCLAPVAFDQDCTVELRSEADLTRDKYSGMCADTLACNVPTVFGTAGPVKCTIAPFVSTPCTFGGDQCTELANSACYVYDADFNTVPIAEGDTAGGVCLAMAVEGVACTTELDDNTIPITNDKLVRACPYTCNFGALYTTSKQAECLNEDGSSATPAPTEAPGTTEAPDSTAAPTSAPEGNCTNGDDCGVGEFCTGADGLIVSDGTGSCYPGAQPGQLCADSTGAFVAFCLSTEGCTDTGIWWTCTGEYKDSAVSTFTTAVVALLATSFLF